MESCHCLSCVWCHLSKRSVSERAAKMTPASLKKKRPNQIKGQLWRLRCTQQKWKDIGKVQHHRGKSAQVHSNIERWHGDLCFCHKKLIILVGGEKLHFFQQQQKNIKIVSPPFYHNQVLAWIRGDLFGFLQSNPIVSRLEIFIRDWKVKTSWLRSKRQGRSETADYDEILNHMLNSIEENCCAVREKKKKKEESEVGVMHDVRQSATGTGFMVH